MDVVIAGSRRALRRRVSGVGGFTLIEVLIVVSVLTFGLLALSAMQLHAMRGGNRGRHATQAVAIAEAQMEQFQQITWTSLPQTVGWTAPAVVNNGVQGGGGSSNEQTYNMQYRVTDMVAGSTRAVDVQVSWNESTGEARSVSLSSIRYNWENL